MHDNLCRCGCGKPRGPGSTWAPGCDARFLYGWVRSTYGNVAAFADAIESTDPMLEIKRLRDELAGETVLKVAAQAERDKLRQTLAERHMFKVDVTPLDNATLEDVDDYQDLLDEHDQLAAELARQEPLIVLCRHLAAAHARGTQANMAKRKRLGRAITELVADLDERE